MSACSTHERGGSVAPVVPARPPDCEDNHSRSCLSFVYRFGAIRRWRSSPLTGLSASRVERGTPCATLNLGSRCTKGLAGCGRARPTGCRGTGVVAANRGRGPLGVAAAASSRTTGLSSVCWTSGALTTWGTGFGEGAVGVALAADVVAAFFCGGLRGVRQLSKSLRTRRTCGSVHASVSKPSPELCGDRIGTRACASMRDGETPGLRSISAEWPAPMSWAVSATQRLGLAHGWALGRTHESHGNQIAKRTQAQFPERAYGVERGVKLQPLQLLCCSCTCMGPVL